MIDFPGAGLFLRLAFSCGTENLGARMPHNLSYKERNHDS